MGLEWRQRAKNGGLPRQKPTPPHSPVRGGWLATRKGQPPPLRLGGWSPQRESPSPSPLDWGGGGEWGRLVAIMGGLPATRLPPPSPTERILQFFYTCCPDMVGGARNKKGGAPPPSDWGVGSHNEKRASPTPRYGEGGRLLMERVGYPPARLGSPPQQGPTLPPFSSIKLGTPRQEAYSPHSPIWGDGSQQERGSPSPTDWGDSLPTSSGGGADARLGGLPPLRLEPHSPTGEGEGGRRRSERPATTQSAYHHPPYWGGEGRHTPRKGGPLPVACQPPYPLPASVTLCPTFPAPEPEPEPECDIMSHWGPAEPCSLPPPSQRGASGEGGDWREVTS